MSVKAAGWLAGGVVGLCLWWGTVPCPAQIESSPSPGSPYQIVSTQEQADTLFGQVRTYLLESWGITVDRPVKLSLVEASVMDGLMSSNAYKGAEIGLYVPGLVHTIYVMKDWNQDLCGGVMAHEFTHAWQNEHCPRTQELPVKEGFAVWIQYKYLDHIGAYTLARGELDYQDPVYGVGIKTMLAWEDKLGAKGLVEYVQHVSHVSDTPSGVLSR